MAILLFQMLLAMYHLHYEGIMNQAFLNIGGAS